MYFKNASTSNKRSGEPATAGHHFQVYYNLAKKFLEAGSSDVNILILRGGVAED